jgi:HEAT repeat protein
MMADSWMGKVLTGTVILLGVLAVPSYGQDMNWADERLLRQSGVGTSCEELIRLLGQHKWKPTTAVRVHKLIEQLGSESFEERERASRQLRAAGEIALPALERAAKHDDVEIADRAARCARKIQTEKAQIEAAIRVLVRRQDKGTVQKLLRLSNPLVRCRCLETVEFIGLWNSGARQAVLVAMGDEDERVKRAASSALAQRLEPEPKVLAEVLRCTQHGKPGVRAGAIFFLYKFKDRPKQCLPVILAAMKDRAACVRRYAAFVLLHFPGTEEGVTALIAALDDPDVAATKADSSVAHAAAWSLGCQGKVAAKAVPALIRKTNSKDTVLRYWAFQALGKLGQQDDTLASRVLPCLMAALSDKSVEVRIEAAGALSDMGPRGGASVGSLRKALKSTDISDPMLAKQLRSSILYALARMGIHAKAAVPELLAVVRDPHSSMSNRLDAVQALGGIGTRVRAVTVALHETLRQAMSDGDSVLIKVTVEALQQLGR